MVSVSALHVGRWKSLVDTHEVNRFVLPFRAYRLIVVATFSGHNNQGVQVASNSGQIINTTNFLAGISSQCSSAERV